MSSDATKKSAYQEFRSRLIVGCSSILLILAAGLVWKVNADYDAATRTTTAQTSNLVLAIEAYVTQALDAMNAPLSSVAETISKQSANGVVSATDIKAILTTPLLPTTANYWVMFINAEGHAVAASNDLSVAGVSYADRTYFSTQKLERNTGLFIGYPTIGRVSKQRVYFVSKRVEDANHEFLGVVVAVVDPKSFAEVLDHSLYQKSLSATIVSRGGKIIARAPRYEASFGKDISNSDVFTKIAISPSGTYQSVSLVDNDLRTYSYRAISKYPLIVSVGMLSPVLTDILAQDASEITAGVICILMVLLLGSRVALNSFRNVEAYATRQQELNLKLDKAQIEVEAGARRARMIADNMPALVSYIDSEQRYQFRNSFYQEIPGIDFKRMIGRTLLEVFGAEVHATVEKEVARALMGESLVFERALPGKNGQTLWLRYQYSPDNNDDGTVAGFYTLVSDVTDMKEIQHQLMALSRVDALTDMPNRTALCERIGEVVARTTRRNHNAAIPEKIGCLFLDIDHFKLINDTHGHDCGDAVLKEFGARLKACIRQSDMASRLAGDEFVILLEGLEQPEGASAVASKILVTMTEPFITEYGQLNVTTSIGIAVSSRRDETPDSLLRQADIALYEAKKKGRNTFFVSQNNSVTA